MKGKTIKTNATCISEYVLTNKMFKLGQLKIDQSCYIYIFFWGQTLLKLIIMTFIRKELELCEKYTG